MEPKQMAKGVFHWIAPIYGLFYASQRRRYAAVLDMAQHEVDLSGYRTIIDVGCGTGALCSVLSQRGFVVTGVDPVKRMLTIAATKQEDGAVEFVQASVLETMPFEDRAFDVSIASYVAHGLRECERETMYAEMSRVTKHLVIIYDYNGKRSLLTDAIERLEGGDYFSFIRNARAEMEKHFRGVRVVDVGERAAWYVCRPGSRSQ